MQKLSDTQLLKEIEAVRPLVAASEESPDTRRALLELDLGRRNLLGDVCDSNPEQLAERALACARAGGLADRLIMIGWELEHRKHRLQVEPDDLLKQLADTTTDRWRLYHKLRHWSESEAFEFLFPIACDCGTYPWPAYNIAAELLIRLDPRCPLTCREALVRISGAKLEASLRTLPFYLVTQFGKHSVLDETAQLLSAPDLSERARQNVGTVRYWASMPPSELCRLS